MKVQDILNYAMFSAAGVMQMYLADISDAEFIERPVPEANHLAWQIGHITASIQSFLLAVGAVEVPKLEASFLEQHALGAGTSNQRADFKSKDEYLKLFKEQFDALISFINGLADEKLDQPAPENMQKYAATLGDAIMSQSTHITMHAGQVAVLRRKLDKPIVI